MTINDDDAIILINAWEKPTLTDTVPPDGDALKIIILPWVPCGNVIGVPYL